MKMRDQSQASFEVENEVDGKGEKGKITYPGLNVFPRLETNKILNSYDNIDWLIQYISVQENQTLSVTV